MATPLTYRCARCRIELNDNVQYRKCPSCKYKLESIDVPPVEPSRFERGFNIAWTTAHVLVWVQVALSLLMPTSFRYVIVATLAIQLFALRSLVIAALSPAALVRSARDLPGRVAHGLEHATIAILRAQGIAVSEGQSRSNSFFVVLPEEPRPFERRYAVEAAARAAIERIKSGETELAYAPTCGTSRVLGRAVAALLIAGLGIAWWFLGVPHGIVFALSVIAIAVGRLVAAPLGLLGQRLWTVSTAFSGARIVAITRHMHDKLRQTRFEVALELAPT